MLLSRTFGCVTFNDIWMCYFQGSLAVLLSRTFGYVIGSEFTAGRTKCRVS